ncbi:site-specific integrase [Methylobacterium sp. J-088]|uniref:tyrosine-type recombinase/integrase n=1 Tax=Methylobacterium sp. J-088 TaxID=2836664 RepID=UPI001FBAC44E|nr:tyrosine-type recombinase/integrase [Methylobacterium sp. J-088]MCJ2065994.1 site-specific integrase [Methylobacterium sp. J-088]
MALITQAQARPYLDREFYETTRTTGLLTYRGPAVVALAYGCGLRVTEILRLKRKQWRVGGEGRVRIDPDEGPPGTQRPLSFGRVVPIADHVAKLVDDYLSRLPKQPGPDDCLIRSAEGGDIRRNEFNGLMKMPGRGMDDVEYRTLASFTAAFACAMAHEEDERLAAYVIGGRPPDGSPWVKRAPPWEQVMTIFRRHSPLWKIDRSFYHAIRRRGDVVR